ncbi:MAG: UDP-N-acetylmuramoyl-tripeptide--D-alanyl-D-alanine ligase [Thermodesulfobacteriota bacterium]
MAPIPWTINDLLSATGGELMSGAGQGRFATIATDSRRSGENDVFVAICGQRFDAHDFAADVIGKGGRCVIVDRNKAGDLPLGNWREQGVNCIAVGDTISALGALAAYNRKRAGVPVIAITGSNGKTTTKEMTAAICRRRFSTLATSGNLNNEIGMPLTLLQLEPTHELAVLELGMNHPGEIGRLSAICRPDIGVITNVGPAHLAGLGDLETVAAAKGELLEHIDPEGATVLNADDSNVLALQAKAKTRTVLFGTQNPAQIRAGRIRQEDGTIGFDLILPDSTIAITLHVYGGFMTYNALAAASAAHQLGIGPEEIKTGLESFSAVKGRMAIYETGQGAYLIDDTYNANPGSMAAAISTLAGLTGKKRGILVAGDMLELGDAAARHHEEIGEIAASQGITRLYLTGEFAARVAQGARAGGMAGNNIFVGTRDDIVKDLASRLESGDWVLVKGSRSTGMEEIVAQLRTVETEADGVTH